MTFPDKSIDTIAATALPTGNSATCNCATGNWQLGCGCNRQVASHACVS